MPEWEYRHSTLAVETGDTFPLDAVFGQWATHCTALGQEGWELISYESRPAEGVAEGKEDEFHMFFSGMFKRHAREGMAYLEAAAYLRRLAQMIEASTSS